MAKRYSGQLTIDVTYRPRAARWDVDVARSGEGEIASTSVDRPSWMVDRVVETPGTIDDVARLALAAVPNDGAARDGDDHFYIGRTASDRWGPRSVREQQRSKTKTKGGTVRGALAALKRLE